MASDTALVLAFLFGLLGHLEYRIDKIYQLIRGDRR